MPLRGSVALSEPKKQQLLVDGQVALQAHLDLFHRMEDVGIDGIGDGGDLLPDQECALACQSFQPPAASHENDMCPAQHLSLPPEHLGREVVRAAPVQEQGTVVAFGLVFRALPAVMADAGKRPLVVHRPHDGFAAVYDAAYVFQGKEALVDPMQVDDIGFLEFRQCGDVRTGVGQVHLEQVVLLEPVGFPDADAFPYEFGFQQGGLGQASHRNLVRPFVAH